MAEDEPPISLGLNQPPAGSATAPTVIRPEDLQFEQAIPIGTPIARPVTFCAACKSAIAGQYFHAQGLPVCPLCARKIEIGQQAPPAVSLLRAALYGGGAAFAGFLIYATVSIALDLQLALISILVGIMVGKAVRKGSYGLGGRPQQILAVALTYFAITTSYIPVYIYQQTKSSRAAQARKDAQPNSQSLPGTTNGGATKRPSLGVAILILLAIALAAPFLSLASGISGLLNLAIIFFGLQNAWKLTGRTDLFITGPYGPADANVTA
jgi:hypothetical protein